MLTFCVRNDAEMDRARIRERFQATLAGLMELDLLKTKHQEIIEAALEFGVKGQSQYMEKDSSGKQSEVRTSFISSDQFYQYGLLDRGSSLMLTRSFSQDTLSGSEGDRLQPIRSSISSQNLLQRTPSDPSWRGNLESGASAGFYDNSTSLSTSCDSIYSVTSYGSEDWEENKAGRMDHNMQQQSLQHRSRGRENPLDPQRPLSRGDITPISGFLSIADLCPQSHWQAVSSILQPQMVLDRKYRLDLISFKTSDVYQYPSPLHAVALQSSLYTPALRSQPPVQGSSAEQSREETTENNTSAEANSELEVEPVSELQLNTVAHFRPSLELCSLHADASASRCFGQKLISFSNRCRLEKFISEVALRHSHLSAAAHLIADVEKRLLESNVTADIMPSALNQRHLEADNLYGRREEYERSIFGSAHWDSSHPYKHLGMEEPESMEQRSSFPRELKRRFQNPKSFCNQKIKK
ncbi:dapper 1-A-like [Amia ocellicauda]|uniref:dapper 1-A-like n=1 Tax=Amia ocellicauda TaxID=2972642 RepID=UPI0034642AC9